MLTFFDQQNGGGEVILVDAQVCEEGAQGNAGRRIYRL